MDEPNILVKTALNEAVQKINEGMSPTAALSKVASDFDLNPNFIQRTGEALNVALHYKHFKTASDRSLDFEIADISKAIQKNFTNTEKTAAEYVSEVFPDSPQNDVVFNYTRILNNPLYKRAFLEIDGATETHEAFPPTLNTLLEKSANYVQKLARQVEDADVAHSSIAYELNDTFSSLCDAFKKEASYRTSFDEFESQVYSKHGEPAVPYLDLIYKTAKIREDRGVHDSKYIMYSPSKEAALFDQLMTLGAALAHTEKQAEEHRENLAYETDFLKAAHRELAKKSAEMPEALREAKKKESPEHEKQEEVAEKPEEREEAAEEDTEDEDNSLDPVLARIKKKASRVDDLSTSGDPVMAAALEKEAFLGSMGSLMNVGKFLAGPVHDIAHEQASHAFSAGFGKHTSTGGKPNLTLENMERKLLLQELMMTDSILSKVNPVKVARAFEQLMRLSPEISKEKEVVRAELRAMVASQALSKYDADLMTKLDTGMLKRRIATHQFNTGHTENFRF